MIGETAARLRREYESEGLDPAAMAADPFLQFEVWFQGVLDAGIHEPNAFVLATADSEGQPSARAVLMKDFSEAGLVFFTGTDSAKSRQMRANPRAAATFVWTPLHRQVRFAGGVAPVSTEVADGYFATRPRGSQIAAHASYQSQVVQGRADLEEAFARIEQKFGDGPIPRPDRWGGWRLDIETAEFWQGRPNRFHDRLRYHRSSGSWTLERLAP